jgi:YidC/Oxa1 family membrane protein insertase
MDRNSIIGIILIVAILFGYTMYTMPSAEERAQAQHVADSTAAADREKREAEIKAQETTAQVADSAATPVTPADSLVASMDSALEDSLRNSALQQRYGVFQASAEGSLEEIVIANERLEVSISTHGAQPTVIRLKEYQTYHQKPLLLADPDSGTYEVKFRAGNAELSTRDLHFTVASKDSNAVVLRAATTEPGKFLQVTYKLDSISYFMHMNAEFTGLKNVVDSRSLLFRWELLGLSNEKYREGEMQKSGIYYKYFNEDRSYIGETSAEEAKLEGRANWVAFKQDFFTVAMVSEEGFSSNGSEAAVVPLDDSTHTKKYSAKLFFDKDRDAEPALAMRFYLGPNHYGTLKRTEIDGFEKIIDLGWGIFGWMNQWLVIPIFNWLDGWNWSYGIIILVLTIAIKLLLMPLTYKNLVASTKMRVLKPEMDAINEKHKDGDAMKKQSATMDLYRKAGVNPASGCLPMLVQMPVLFAMFKFFPSSIELRQESFLWADDLSTYDSILDLSFTVPLNYGNHVSLFTILMCASTVIYTMVNSKQMPTQQGMPSMKIIMYLFPVMMLFFMNSLPAGLSYYYLLANVISILQMTLLKSWFVNEDKIRAQLLTNMKTPKKKSRWQQRLEDMQKQQQAARRR